MEIDTPLLYYTADHTSGAPDPEVLHKCIDENCTYIAMHCDYNPLHCMDLVTFGFHESGSKC